MISPELKSKIQTTIQKILGYFNVSFSMDITDEDLDSGKIVNVFIQTEEGARYFIGKNGQSLQALEIVLRNMFRNESEIKNISVDVNDYKRSKASQLLNVALEAVSKVRSTQKALALEPMSSYERRIVHMELASHPDIVTESIGEGSKRRIVIKPLSHKFS